MRKFLFIMSLPLILKGDDRIIAWVDNEVITQRELDYASKEVLNKNGILEALINSILLQKKALELGIDVQEAMVLERIEEIKETFSSASLFNSALAIEGMDEGLLKKRIKNELTKARLINLLKEKIRIGEDELLLNFSQWQSEVDVSFLEFKNEADANRVFLELTKNGTTSHEMQNTGFFCYPEMNCEFSKVAFSLDEGKISHPFKIGDKFYIIKRKRIRNTEASHLAKIADELFMENRGRIRQRTPNETMDDLQHEILSLSEERLKNQRFKEYFAKFLEGIRKEAYIKIKNY